MTKGRSDRNQGRLLKDERLKLVKDLRQKIAAIETPDISWEGKEGKMKTKPCPCECNSGGFCGGCGHAGCGGR